MENSELLCFSPVTIWALKSPKQNETGLITGYDQTVRAVHSCSSWFGTLMLDRFIINILSDIQQLTIFSSYDALSEEVSFLPYFLSQCGQIFK